MVKILKIPIEKLDYIYNCEEYKIFDMNIKHKTYFFNCLKNDIIPNISELYEDYENRFFYKKNIRYILPDGSLVPHIYILIKNKFLNFLKNNDIENKKIIINNKQINSIELIGKTIYIYI